VSRTRARFYDPTGKRFGLPTFPWRWAPAGLATMRQLTALGLRPAGQPVAAQVIWQRGRGRPNGIAYLYKIALAKPKRTPTPDQRAALAKALAARCTCPECGVVYPHCLPRRTGGVCLSCAGELTVRIAA
jgi:hypothetical protein